MKKIYLSLLFICSLCAGFGQLRYFDICDNCHTHVGVNDDLMDDSIEYYIEIDTSQINNLWQIGTSDKSLIDTNLRANRFLMTDTINNYHINNISSFLFTVINCYENWNCGYYENLRVAFTIKIDSDSLLDGGTIEVSHNHGPWTNLINDTFALTGGNIYTNADTVASLHQPGFSGSDSTWKLINIAYYRYDYAHDTIQLRFTFSSDSIETNKAGWAIRAFAARGIYEGVEEIRNESLITLYPNPADDILAIKTLLWGARGSIEIYTAQGQMVYANDNFNDEMISTKDFLNGIYYLKYKNAETYDIEKFVVQHR
jgi:Secretion system C-terminal sorting domain